MVGSVKLSAPRIQSSSESMVTWSCFKLCLELESLESAFSGLWKAQASMLIELESKLHFLQRGNRAGNSSIGAVETLKLL